MTLFNYIFAIIGLILFEIGAVVATGNGIASLCGLGLLWMIYFITRDFRLK